MKNNSQVKKEYMMNKTNTAVSVPVSQQEKIYKQGSVKAGSLYHAHILWLKQIISDHGGTPSGRYGSDLAKQACALLGIHYDSNYQANLRRIYDSGN